MRGRQFKPDYPDASIVINQHDTRRTSIKTIKVSLRLGKNDLERKMKQVTDFLTSKEQVKIQLTLKGREKAHPERGVDFLNNLYETHLSTHGKCAKQATEASLHLTLMPTRVR